MSMNPYFFALVPVGALVAVVLGGALILRTQRRGSGVPPMAGQTAVDGLRQAPGETREDFVLRHRDRPGVVANGATLVDLYERIRRLEERVAAVESASGPPAPPSAR